MAKVLCILLAAAACLSLAYGQTTLTAETTTACSAAGNVPTGSGVTVTFKCTITGTGGIAAIEGANTAGIVFKKDGSGVFEVAVGVTDVTMAGSFTEVTSQSGIATYTMNDVTGSGATTVLTVVYANFPTDAPGAWTCEVTDTNSNTLAEASTSGVDLTAFCGTMTLTASPSVACVSDALATTGTLTLTCDLVGTKTISNANTAAATGLVIRKGTTAYYTSATATTITTGTGAPAATVSSTGTSTGLIVVITDVSTIAAADKTATWTCEFTGGTSADGLVGYAAGGVLNTLACSGGSAVFGSMLVVFLAALSSLML